MFFCVFNKLRRQFFSPGGCCLQVGEFTRAAASAKAVPRWCAGGCSRARLHLRHPLPLYSYGAYRSGRKYKELLGIHMKTKRSLHCRREWWYITWYKYTTWYRSSYIYGATSCMSRRGCPGLVCNVCVCVFFYAHDCVVPYARTWYS